MAWRVELKFGEGQCKTSRSSEFAKSSKLREKSSKPTEQRHLARQVGPGPGHTSKVLSGIDGSVKAHANLKRPVDWSHESGFRYVLHSKGDTNRELILTVLVFHIPK